MAIKIKKDKEYRVKESKHFKKKYGEENPIIKIEDRDKVVFGAAWQHRQYVPAVVAFMMRQINDNLHSKENEKVYYGKIGYIGELVFESELEVV